MRFNYSKWQGPRPEDLQFIKQLMEIYRNLLLQTGGDVDEALRWMEHFGEQYGFFGDRFGIEDFKKLLEKSGEVQRTARGFNEHCPEWQGGGDPIRPCSGPSRRNADLPQGQFRPARVDR